MKRLVALLALLGSACQAPQAVRETGFDGGARSCIDLSQVTGQRVERGQLIYHLSNGKTLTNDLGGHCPPLLRATGSEIIQTEMIGSQLCRGDGIRVYDPATVGAGGPASVLRCPAGDFVSVTGR